jgi:hypothetical protein
MSEIEDYVIRNCHRRGEQRRGEQRMTITASTAAPVTYNLGV